MDRNATTLALHGTESVGEWVDRDATMDDCDDAINAIIDAIGPLGMSIIAAWYVGDEDKIAQ